MVITKSDEGNKKIRRKRQQDPAPNQAKKVNMSGIHFGMRKNTRLTVPTRKDKKEVADLFRLAKTPTNL